jgi:hypothetical protein
MADVRCQCRRKNLSVLDARSCSTENKNSEVIVPLFCEPSFIVVAGALSFPRTDWWIHFFQSNTGCGSPSGKGRLSNRHARFSFVAMTARTNGKYAPAIALLSQRLRITMVAVRIYHAFPKT